MMKMVKIEETIKEPEPPKKELKVKLTSKLAIPSKQAPQARVQSIPITVTRHLMGPPPPKVEEPEIKPYEDNYESYQPCAIPRQKTELNYQYAMARMMHSKNKKYLSTRRDMTIRQI